MQATTAYHSDNGVLTVTKRIDGGELSYITIYAGAGKVNINVAMIPELMDALLAIHSTHGNLEEWLSSNPITEP